MNDFSNIAQLLGLGSYALGILMFFQTDDRRLKILMMIFSLNHTVHFWLLSAPVAALSSLLGVFRTLGSIFTSSKFVAIIFIALSLLLGGLIAETSIELLATLGSCVGTFSIYQLKGIALRVGLLFGSICWLFNNMLVGSVGGILLEATVIVINLFTIYRLYSELQSGYTKKHELY